MVMLKDDTYGSSDFIIRDCLGSHIFVVIKNISKSVVLIVEAMALREG